LAEVGSQNNRQKAAAAGRDLRLVGDQVGCPTFAADLAQAIRELIQRNGRGIVHAANTGNTTWFAFAEYFVNRTFPGVSITPVTTDEYPRPAKRPPYSVLSTDRLKRILGHPMPAWQDAVDRYLGLKYPERIKE
ncbi:MAG TPA: sugar nucleotide-binding protein, partial [bacterium]|nr:sugar nucleotide-binding protein [bacterium]